MGKRPRLSSFVGYLLLSWVAYYPRGLYLWHYPSRGLPEFDTGMYFWNFWWTWRQLTAGASIYTSDLIFYPRGAELSFHALHLFNSLFVLPFEALGIPQLGYNLFFLGAAVFTGWGLFLLCQDLRMSAHVAWVAGALFVLCPYRFGHLVHFDLINTAVFPFYLLFMRRALLRGAAGNCLLWGLWLFFAANASWYYLLFLLVLSPLWLVHVVTWGKLKEYWRVTLARTCLAAVSFAVLILPQMMVILRQYQPDRYQRPLDALLFWSADLCNFVLHPWIGQFLERLNPYYLTSLGGRGEFSVFPGIVVYALVIAAVRSGKEMAGRFWLGVALLGAFLSLGPALKVVMPVRVSSDHFLWLPGYVFHQLPLFGAARAVARWSLLFQLGLILFIASNYHLFEARWNRRFHLSSFALSGAIVILTLAENWAGPLPHSPRVPLPVWEQLQRQGPPRTVLHLPLVDPRVGGRLGGYYMYLQTRNGLPMCSGYTSFDLAPPEVAGRPVLRLLQGMARERIDQEILEQDLRELDLGWVVVHPGFYFTPEEPVYLGALLRDHLGFELYAREHGMEIYRRRGL